MIRYLIILNNHNGASMFAHSFGCFSSDATEGFEERLHSMDPDILGSFLQTLAGVGSRMFNKDHVQEIGFEGFSVMALRQDLITVVGVVEGKGEKERSRELLEDVARSFRRMFDAQITSWDGDVDRFSSFLDTLIEDGFIDETLEQCDNCINCPPSKHCLPRLVISKAGKVTE